MVMWDHGNDQAQEDAWERRLRERIDADPSRYIAPQGKVNAQSLILAEADEIEADRVQAEREDIARGIAAAHPVVDANGDVVAVPEGTPVDVARMFFAGRVPAPACPHYMAVSEVRAGLTTCECC